MDAQLVFPYASNSFYNRLYQLYPRSNYNSTFYQRVDWYSDFIVCCPTMYQAQALSDSSYFNTSAVFKVCSILHQPTKCGTDVVQMIMSAGKKQTNQYEVVLLTVADNRQAPSFMPPRKPF
jgi:hypothetical protein